MDRPVTFISRVRLRNYKSIAECDVGLGPLTILVGPNGSGKSNFLDALAFLARAVATSPQEAIDERGGLGETLRRVPGPTDKFSLYIEFSFTDGVEKQTGSYGIEIARGSAESASFIVTHEECALTSPRGHARYEANAGLVRDFARRQSTPTEVAIEPDQLYLQVARTQKSFAQMYRLLRDMHFYNFSLDVLRSLQPVAAQAVLGQRGEHIGDVLDALEDRRPQYKQRLDAYLRGIVPDATGIDPWFAGQYSAIKLRSPTGLDGRDVVFDPIGISDGTVRAVGVLAALFQIPVVDGRVPVVGIEEPEIALHPAAAGVLFDALTEASQHVQVVATSQSPDLLDREDLDVSTVRAVSMRRGLTVIGEIDAASRQIVRDKLYTLGELMRSNQLVPDSLSNGSGMRPEA